jgi:signal transduction histidine kinase
VPERARSLILEKTEGNPFFVEEVIRSLLDSEVMVQNGAQVEMVRELYDISIPDTLTGVPTTRLDRLDDAAKRTAQNASVIGREFRLDLLLAIGSTADIEASLDHLQRRGLIRETSRVPHRIYTFKHTLTQETAPGSLLLSRRRELHRDIADWLETETPDADRSRAVEGAIQSYAAARSAIKGAGFIPEQLSTLNEESSRAVEVAARPPDIDTLTRSDLEADVERLLGAAGSEEPREVAPALVSLGYGSSELEELAGTMDSPQLVAAAELLASTFVVHNLLAEISQGAGRVSEIVKALKSDSFLNQAPIQEVGLHEGFHNTLRILKSKLGAGIVVRREYADDIPPIQAHGSELNQVWTNLIDNAAYVLRDGGNITIRTRREGDEAVVEVEDDGPGIPEEIKSRVFDAFFTIKPPGQGTGMGLGITYSIIVNQHGGDIQVESNPGKTVFTVRLPI